MPRPPSIRRPVMEAVAENVARIQRKQKKNPEYILTTEEQDTLLAAAKVAAALDRVKASEPDEDDEKPVSPAEREAALKRLEQTSPARVKRGAADEDDA